MLDQLAILKAVVCDPVSAIELLIESVIAQLKAYKLEDEQAHSETGTQPKDVDGRIQFVFPQAAKSCF
jgi:hypothetical protein